MGVSKTGVSGLSVLFAGLFASLMPAKVASGFALPLLMLGDFIAVASYRQHTRWQHLWRMFPATALGVIVGYFAMSRITDRQATTLVGSIICSLVALHAWRRWRLSRGELGEHGWWFAATIGVLAGFATLIANAAGPLMAIYFLALRLPKMEFMGTGATFYLLMNFFKLPFMIHLGLITPASLSAAMWLTPAVVAGTLLGRVILQRINQKWFESTILALAVLAGLNVLRQAWH
ncbi:sulfite exporter TauE/SafE family protein [Horticoccus luteus]|uniref:Probable membrane transporter protein n=2 Tax=Horticoccus luteus TaxID=2862869 RepID=A0A8F9XMZ9_9BACT|nr:sulfite exporter TauE/SafE family protein [Horticoccus luteus]